MKSAFIIHGAYANPDINWYPWLKTELEKLGYTVFTPKFPTPEHQSLQAWMEVFAPYRKNLSPESIIIGHSVGCAFALHLIEEVAVQVNGTFLVAPFIHELPHEGFNLVNATFITTPFNWKSIHESMGRVKVLASDNDPYVPIETSKEVADLLGIKVQTVSGRGHFDAASDTYQLPELVELIATIDQPEPTPADRATEKLNQELELAGIDLHIDGIAEKDLPDHINRETNLRDKDFEIDHHIDATKTYYEDIADTLTNADTQTMAQILEGERERREALQAKKKHITNNLIYAALTLVCILAAFIFIRRARLPEVLPQITEQESFFDSYIRIDEQSAFVVNNKTYFALQNEIQEIHATTQPNIGQIHDLIPINEVAGVQRRLDLANLLAAVEAETPPVFLEALGDAYLYGVYGGNEPHAFLLINIDSFDRAFEGIQAWETTMVKDLQDLLALDPSVIHPGLYDRTFTDKLSNNFQLRILEAPSYERVKREQTREEKLPQPPQRHTLSSDVLETIEDIIEDEIIFLNPHEFLRELNIGDIIIGRASDERLGFLRVIQDFEQRDGRLVIKTRDANASEASLQSSDRQDVVIRYNDEGRAEYYKVIEEVVTEFVEGPTVPVLMYTFLSDKELLITTNEDVIREVVERLASRERDAE